MLKPIIDPQVQAMRENAAKWPAQKKKAYMRRFLEENVGSYDGKYLGEKRQFPNGCENGECLMGLDNPNPQAIKEASAVTITQLSVKQKMVLKDAYDKGRLPFNPVGDLELMV